MGEVARGTQLDLKPLKELADEVVRQYHEFSEFHFLFYGPQARVDLLNAVAKHFFGDLFGIMLDRLILGVSKLTDSAGSGSRTNLSLAYVHNGLVQDARYPKAEAEQLIEQAMSVHKHLEVWRSKRIAHNDVSVALGLRDAGEVIPERIKEFLSVAERYLNLVQGKLGAVSGFIIVKPRRATAFGPARHWHFAGGASTPPLTKGMLRAPLEPQHKVPRPQGGA